MNRVVLWSGGMDSTYLILNSISNGYNVSAYYVDVNNNDIKTKMELDSISKQIPLLKEQYGNYFNYKGILTKFEAVSGFADSIVFKQAPIWLLSLLYSDMENVDSVAMGYVMNDDAISYIEDFKNIWNSFSPLFKNKIPSLDFPLYKMKKEEFILDMEKYIDLCVYCEAPRIEDDKFINCLSCDSCKRHSRLIHHKLIETTEISNKQEKIVKCVH